METHNGGISDAKKVYRGFTVDFTSRDGKKDDAMKQLVIDGGVPALKSPSFGEHCGSRVMSAGSQKNFTPQGLNRDVVSDTRQMTCFQRMSPESPGGDTSCSKYARPLPCAVELSHRTI